MKNTFDPVRYYHYTLPNKIRVNLSCRPDVCSPEEVKKFIKETNPRVRFQFTDNYVEPPDRGPMWHWFPWVPGNNIPIENVYAFICLMEKEVELAGAYKNQSIWLHCDSSTMRAPTYFGLYCLARWKDKFEEIYNSLEGTDAYPKRNAEFSRIDKYAEVSLKEDPGVKELVEAWQEGGEEKAYKQYMGIKW